MVLKWFMVHCCNCAWMKGPLDMNGRMMSCVPKYKCPKCGSERMHRKVILTDEKNRTLSVLHDRD